MSDHQRGMSLRPLVTMLVIGCVAANFVWPPGISMDTALGAVTVGAFLRMLGAGLLVLVAIYVASITPRLTAERPKKKRTKGSCGKHSGRERASPTWTLNRRQIGARPEREPGADDE